MDASEPAVPPVHSIDEFRTAYEEGRRLRGFRSACGFVTATWGLLCPRCGRSDLAEVDLPPRGTVAAVTVQHVPGDEFLNDAPYAYLLVDLDGGGRISGWAAGVRSESDLPIGTPVRWVPSYKPGVQFEALAPGGDAPAGGR